MRVVGLEPTTYGLKDGAMNRFQNSQDIALTHYKIYTYEIECRVFLRGKVDRYAAQRVVFDGSKVAHVSWTTPFQTQRVFGSHTQNRQGVRSLLSPSSQVPFQWWLAKRSENVWLVSG